MPSRLSCLLLLAAVLGAAHAARELDDVSADAGRHLLQASPNATDCDRSVKNCIACRYQFYRGTVTKAICTTCATGYVVKASGRACYCAPGYFANATTDVTGQVGFTCYPCEVNHYCPGAKITPESSTVRTRCGDNKLTTTEFGKSDRECVVKPGYGWGTGDTSAVCEQGWYNPGYNTRKCTKCPGSLTTTGNNMTSSQDCQAPIGSYYLRGKAVACARGTYKEYIGNNDCDECPIGMTTPLAQALLSNRTQCNIVEPGYTLAAGATLGSTNATQCPQDTFRAGEVNISDPSVAASNCTACGENLVTLPNVTCLTGTYNPGYNREPCVKCGNGTITTVNNGSTNADECYTPAGHGNRRDTISGVLEGYLCPKDSYGRPNNTFGLVDVECTKCPENSHTAQNASTSSADCLTDAGYGWEDGSVLMCEFGYYAVGGTQDKCTYCGAGYNTTNATSSTSGEPGSDSESDCKLDFGYQNGTNSGTIEPCLRGWYKPTVSFDSCTQCPAGTSTTITMAAVNKTDCDTCRPGFGAATTSGKINVTDINATIECTICASGTYSPGFYAGGANCTVCPKTQNFTGTMVSREGAWSPEECYGEFITDGASEQNFLWWDIILHNDSSRLELTTTTPPNTKEACQTACSGDAQCQYFVFYDKSVTYGDNTCYLRKAGDLTRIGNGTTDDAWWNEPGMSIVLFEIKEGSYVVYPKYAAETIGEPLSLTGSTSDFKAMRTACDNHQSCIGLTYDVGAGWQGFKGTLWEDAVGKVRVKGESINSWVRIPTGLEDPEGWTMTN
ncbi:MAG: hypothetical protein J3K34DRAFT_521329 [Monoraphidium minutum]|nr:MAG: hypothetical protein J3K34DRAFT_521329 [Monoraphidium minutum]